MNRFLTPLTNAILARKGTIDKYMATPSWRFWNAPIDDREHQINACEAAVDMLDRIDELNTQREIEAQHGGHVYIPLNVGVGLNTGVCVVGNMGPICASTIPRARSWTGNNWEPYSLVCLPAAEARLTRRPARNSRSADRTPYCRTTQTPVFSPTADIEREYRRGRHAAPRSRAGC